MDVQPRRWLLDHTDAVHFDNLGAWRRWLEEHHATETGLWLVIQKKASSQRGVRYEESVEEALRFGWIDGKVRARDEEVFTQRFTPRKPNSNWSESNKARVQRLIAEGRMTPAGMAHVEAARKDGRWVPRGDGQDAASMPADLEKALRAEGDAWDRFGEFANSFRNSYI